MNLLANAISKAIVDYKNKLDASVQNQISFSDSKNKATQTSLSFKIQIAAGKKNIETKPYNFKGLKAGDKWCLCALRWVEASNNGCAPKLLLESTNIKTLDFVSLEKLLEHQA